MPARMHGARPWETVQFFCLSENWTLREIFAKLVSKGLQSGSKTQHDSVPKIICAAALLGKCGRCEFRPRLPAL